MSRAQPPLTNGAATALPESAESLQAVVRAERSELKRTLDALETAVRGKMDVRARLLAHPLTTVGVACATGVVLGVLSNRVQGRDEDRSGHAPVKRAAGGMAVVAAPFAKMAASVSTLVAQRVADVAEEALRRALATRKR